MPPISAPRSHASARDLADCREMLRRGSKTFFQASLLLPHRVREPAGVIYAFCRFADDQVDLERAPLEAVARLGERLRLAAEGRPLASPIDRALADVLDRHAIPVAVPEALLEGLAWDVGGRRYQSFADLQSYAVRVAGTVGAMMALLMGARSRDLVAGAIKLGIAMQLTNIARDVGEDARNGRIYLPLDWLQAAGVDPQAFLAAPSYTPAVAGLVRRLTAVADDLYEDARPAIDALPVDCRPGIHAARLLYREIGRSLIRRGVDPVQTRTVVPQHRKLVLVARAVAEAVSPGLGARSSGVAEGLFLEEAVAAHPRPVRVRTPRGFAAIDDRAGWVFDLCHRLEVRDRTAPARLRESA
jgi:phytoene synthase